MLSLRLTQAFASTAVGFLYVFPTAIASIPITPGIVIVIITPAISFPSGIDASCWHLNVKYQ